MSKHLQITPLIICSCGFSLPVQDDISEAEAHLEQFPDHRLLTAQQITFVDPPGEQS